MNGLKPIETTYKGFRFRSRLEARWAVFFDSLSVKWEYEPEGFEFVDGTKYLPDFKVYGFGNSGNKHNWFEVKPDIDISLDTAVKLRNLANMENQQVFLLQGPPDFRPYKAFHHDEIYKRHIKEDHWGDVHVQELMIHGELVGFGTDKHGIKGLYVYWGCENDFDFLYREDWPHRDNNNWHEDIYCKEYVKAVFASRSARFEFGEIN